MKNIEYLQSLSTEEFAAVISSMNRCNFCEYEDQLFCPYDEERCIEGITKYLNSRIICINEYSEM